MIKDTEYNLCPENLNELIKYLEDNTQYFKSKQVKLLIQLAKENEKLKEQNDKLREYFEVIILHYANTISRDSVEDVPLNLAKEALASFEGEK